MSTVTLEASLAVFLELNIVSPHNPAITLLGIYPKELKSYVHINLCPQMFIAGRKKKAPSEFQRQNCATHLGLGFKSTLHIMYEKFKLSI